MTSFLHACLRPTGVIPAQAGIQTGPLDVRELPLDSRLRGNDVVEAARAK